MSQAVDCYENDMLALVAMGANLPFANLAPARTIAAALAAVCAKSNETVHLQAVSRFYQSPAFPAGSGPDYVNAAAAFRITSSPAAFLMLLHCIESDFGRARRDRWEARPIDLDLIAVNGLILPDSATHSRWRDLSAEDQRRLAPEELVLPHPRMQDRAFVLLPLAEIAPEWRHPVTGTTVRDMAAALPEAAKAGILPL